MFFLYLCFARKHLPHKKPPAPFKDNLGDLGLVQRHGGNINKFTGMCTYRVIGRKTQILKVDTESVNSMRIEYFV